MSRSLARLIAMVSLTAAIGLIASGTVLGADRIPVSSVDNTSTSLVNRIGAVDNVVRAMDARIDRILRSLPDGHPPGPIFEGLTATQASLHTLITTIDNRLCTTDGTIGSGDASLADSDAFAGDVTSNGLTNQLSAVRNVLAEANGRLVRISGALPSGPPSLEIDQALSAVRHSAAVGFDAIAVRLGTDVHPPSPCHGA